MGRYRDKLKRDRQRKEREYMDNTTAAASFRENIMLCVCNIFHKATANMVR